MTKSTGVGRGKGGGGRQPGAGRPRKTGLPPRLVAGKAVGDAVRTLRTSTSGGDPMASALVAKAYETLSDVMDNSPYPAPRVTAARAVIAMAAREKAELAGQAGKKERQAVAAERAAMDGRFATPSAPKLVVSNPPPT